MTFHVGHQLVALHARRHAKLSLSKVLRGDHVVNMAILVHDQDPRKFGRLSGHDVFENGVHVLPSVVRDRIDHENCKGTAKISIARCVATNKILGKMVGVGVVSRHVGR